MIKKHIPNFVTLLNLFSGCIAIVFAFQGNLILATWFIGFAAVFDFFDGLLARLLNAKSEIGLQLDSLADLISFGLAPAIIVYQMMSISHNIPFLNFYDINIIAFAAFLIPAFSALRLAKFNIDENQSESFIGLPTPANALFFASFPVVMYQAKDADMSFLMEIMNNFWVLLALTLIFSLLMVSNLPLFSLKFKNLRFKDNVVRYIFAFSSILFIILFQLFALPLIVIFYILLSISSNFKKSALKNPS